MRVPSVLVTRPVEQADSLCQRVEALGWHAVRFPLLTIEPVVCPPIDASRYQWLIFISRNAVRQGLTTLQGPLPQLAAVGQGTAEALRRLGHEVDLLPDTTADSEGLLAMPALQKVAGQRILILRGDGGRALLGDSLRQRGAQVDYAEVYRRAQPAAGREQLLALWSELDLVLASSNQSLQHLMALLGDEALARLADKTLLVVSRRGRELADQLGIKRVIEAAGASDEALIGAILRWAEDGNLAGQESLSGVSVDPTGS